MNAPTSTGSWLELLPGCSLDLSGGWLTIRDPAGVPLESWPAQRIERVLHRLAEEPRS